MSSGSPRSRAGRFLRTFPGSLAAITLGAFAIRVLWVILVAGHYELGSDGTWYLWAGRALSGGHGYVHGQVFALITKVRQGGLDVPGLGREEAPSSAMFPPVFGTYLGGVALVVGRSRFVAHLAVCVAGSGTVWCTGLIGQRLGGTRLGLLAAALAAVYPMLILADGTLMSETLFTLLVTLTVLATYRAIEQPNAWRWSTLGLAVGASILTRGEGVLLVPLLVIPAAFALRDTDAPRKVGLGALAILVALVVLVPWTVRNLQTFDRLVPVSTNSGALAQSANCDETYRGRLLGGWSYHCLVTPAVESVNTENPAVESSKQLDVGLTYVQDHAGRLPVVVAARIGRTFGVYRPIQQLTLGTDEGRPYGVALAGWISYLVLVPFAVAGAVVFVRRRVRIAPLVGVLLLVVVTSALTYGNARFRTPLEPVVTLFAAGGLLALFDRVRSRSRSTPRLPAPERAVVSPA